MGSEMCIRDSISTSAPAFNSSGSSRICTGAKGGLSLANAPFAACQLKHVAADTGTDEVLVYSICFVVLIIL